jgi:hypothetical protein
MLDIDELRKVGTCVFLAAEREVAQDIANHIMDAADEIERLRGELSNMHFFLGHIVIAAGGEVTVPVPNMVKYPHPVIMREDRSTPDVIIMTATLQRDSRGMS